MHEPLRGVGAAIAIFRVADSLHSETSSGYHDRRPAMGAAAKETV
jgi:hypothetical protein